MLENETLGKLEEIDDIRTIWVKESTDFTPWLALEENISILSKAIGVDINMDDVCN